MSESSFQIADINGVELRHFSEVASTNLTARDIAICEKPNHSIFILSDQQNAGRGRHGHQWQSPKGNLYGSLLIKPELDHGQIGLLTFVTSLSLYKTIKSYLPAIDIGIKWPNDILIERIKKISGILLETEGDYLIIGVGVNIAVAPDIAGRQTTCLFDYNKAAPSSAAFLRAFLSFFTALYNDFLVQGFAPIKREMEDILLNLGQEIKVRLPNETLHGVFQAFDNNGHLILCDNNGKTRAISAGEVFFS